MSLARAPKEIFENLIERIISEDEQKVLASFKELEETGQLFDVIKLFNKNNISLLDVSAKNVRIILVNFIIDALMISRRPRHFKIIVRTC
jgi:hypothetical protein